MTSRIIDISLTLSNDLAVFPGNPPTLVAPVKRIADGGSSNVSELRVGTHNGTHVDPPSHFIDGGAAADALPLDALIGPAIVADLRRVSGTITPSDLEALSLPEGVERLLLRTTNSDRWAQGGAAADDYVAVSGEAAAWVAGRGVKLLGVDYLSVEVRDAPGRPAHHALLGAGVVILEGLDLSGAPPGAYQLLCLPLKIAGGDGAPARAVLVAE